MSDPSTLATAAPPQQRSQRQQDQQRQRVTLADVHLEFASHADNWPFIALAVGIAAGLLATGPGLADLGWLLLGLAVFVPQEYFTHVHLLHAKLPRSQRRYEWMYRLHYGHHDQPRRHDLMYMPLWLTLPMMVGNVALLWAITLALTPEPRAFWAAFGGAIVGYLVFEWSHLLCHVPFVPRSRLWRHVRTQHLLHHFQNEAAGFSVAPWSLGMDRLMHTQAARSPDVRSDSCRFLGLDAGHPWIAAARTRFAHRSNGDASASRLWLRAKGGSQ